MGWWLEIRKAIFGYFDVGVCGRRVEDPVSGSQPNFRLDTQQFSCLKCIKRTVLVRFTREFAPRSAFQCFQGVTEAQSGAALSVIADWAPSAPATRDPEIGGRYLGRFWANFFINSNGNVGECSTNPRIFYCTPQTLEVLAGMYAQRDECGWLPVAVGYVWGGTLPWGVAFG